MSAAAGSERATFVLAWLACLALLAATVGVCRLDLGLSDWLTRGPW